MAEGLLLKYLWFICTTTDHYMGISGWQAGVARVSGRWGWSWVGLGLVLGILKAW
ncbi:hypothetical protein OAD35_05965 [Pseudomonadales bacterium]|nr:hypothetical protein [Pseudomonadales bacterium]